MTRRTKTLIILGAFCGGFFAAMAGWTYAVETENKHIVSTIFFWAITGAILFGVLSPLTDGRIISFFFIRYDPFPAYETASLSHWKFGFGIFFFFGLLVGINSFGHLLSFFDSLQTWQIYAAVVVVPFLGFGLAAAFRLLPFWLALLFGILGFGTAVFLGIRDAKIF